MNPAAAGQSHPALSSSLTPTSTTLTNEVSLASLNPPPPPPPIVDLTQIENYAMGSCEDPYSSMNLLNH